MITNKFVKAEAKVLTYYNGKDFYVCDCNNQQQVNYAVSTFGKPQFYMTNFRNWQEVAAAKRNYECMLYISKKMPDAEEVEWFWQKQLEDEHPWDPEEYAAKIEEANKICAALPDTAIEGILKKRENENDIWRTE